MYIWGKGRVVGRVRSDFLSAIAGRVGSTFRRFVTFVTRGQLWFWVLRLFWVLSISSTWSAWSAQIVAVVLEIGWVAEQSIYIDENRCDRTTACNRCIMDTHVQVRILATPVLKNKYSKCNIYDMEQTTEPILIKILGKIKYDVPNKKPKRFGPISSKVKKLSRFTTQKF